MAEFQLPEGMQEGLCLTFESLSHHVVPEHDITGH